MNRFKNRFAIAKRHIELLEWCGIPFDGKKKRSLSRWQKLKYCAECIFRWKKKSIVMARGISKPGLVWTRWTYELTGEWLPPPWVITDDETEGEDSK